MCQEPYGRQIERRESVLFSLRSYNSGLCKKVLLSVFSIPMEFTFSSPFILLYIFAVEVCLERLETNIEVMKEALLAEINCSVAVC